MLNYDDIPEGADMDEFIVENPQQEVSQESVKKEEKMSGDEATSKTSENISEELSSEKKESIFVVGKFCLAKWDEDEVWYQVEVTGNTKDGIEVLFSDYGNSSILSPERLVLSFQDIPVEDIANNMIDEHVVAHEAETTPAPLPETEAPTNTSTALQYMDLPVC